jgi:hypothetical protein
MEFKIPEGMMKRWLVVGLVLAFSAMPLQNASAASDMGLKSLGVDLGLVDPENVDGVVGFGASADWGMLSPRVGLSSNLGYWSKSEDLGFGEEVSIRDVSLSTRARYFFPVSSAKFRPYMGGGLGLHFLNAEFSSPAVDLGGGFFLPAMSVSESETKIGIDLGGGFVTPVGAKTDFYGDLWYGIVEDFSQVSMKVGLAWRLN